MTGKGWFNWSVCLLETVILMPLAAYRCMMGGTDLWLGVTGRTLTNSSVNEEAGAAELIDDAE